MKLDSKLLIAGLIAIAGLTLVYSNHFNNPFHFDDAHTIESNAAIRDISNIPTFFKDATTTSSLPANQAYRPGLTTLNAIDFWLSGKEKPEPFQFHLSIFISFVLLGILLYFLFLYIFNAAYPHAANKWIALIAAAFFCYHTANAETINYIIARSDSFSTLMIVASIVSYIYLPKWRKFYIFCMFMVIGFFVKETGAMAVPLLYFLIVFFEKDLSVGGIFKKFFKKEVWYPALYVIPAGLIAIGMFVFFQKMTPETWTSGSEDKWTYIQTQAFVYVHYFNNFVLPVNLSADTDWTLITNPFDDRVLVGITFIIAMLGIAVKASIKRETRPITYGILWFFLALIPTTVVPFAEVLNDHRVFFPYIGLVIAGVWVLARLYYKYVDMFPRQLFNFVTLMLSLIAIMAHATGTYMRNEVWSSGETLWKDVTEKSPLNGRGWMNYGNALMKKGDYEGAKVCFNKTIELWPQYSYAYINMGVLHAATGDNKAAESSFRNSMRFNPNNPECYSYYGKFLLDQKRYQEAADVLSQGLRLSPQHARMQQYYDIVLKVGGDKVLSVDDKAAVIKKNPSAEAYLNLSLEYYNLKRYKDCIEACKEALKLKPDYDVAYNNMCSAYNMLKMWDEAIAAGRKAVELNPNNQLFKNNLNVALKGKRDSQ